ncbi:Dehydrogenase (flavoprotein) [Saccharopolyspora kobensis]|uniref:Dehydrogenase (Flavoprotein) n=2 Tax=Saccharopolyspora kobensis TaxID=146035 RepID=A0A1H5T6A7_9PSEU|nr:styrene monooxygenase/indole monooxygenase family protein [Saccharopolyspora kobensis]SEF58326.1 Dehydrogenase (flavoprotein) [Saccharopolyspora kobensis]SFC49630.1 Dehydrogenase (flavoprotein) [Saccharopolyspora kobensis]
MTRSVAIVGGGVAGLLTGHLLQRDGHRVTLLSGQRPDDLRNGPIISTQCVFGPRLRPERGAGLAFWDDTAPVIANGRLSIWLEEQCVLDWSDALLDSPAQSVDHRMKLATWMEALGAADGATVHHRTVDRSALDALAAEHDLVLVTTGRGGGLFRRNDELSQHTEPQRQIAAVYLRVPDGADDIDTVRWSIVPGAGELLVVPALTFTGPCHAVVVEALPGGPWDVWRDRPQAGELWKRIRELLRDVPREHEALAGTTLTDDRAALSGAITPVVRHPVAVLPSGRAVLGLGDAVVTNDPLTASGANSAVTAAAMHAAAITEHTGAFDAEWMQRTHDAWWTAPGGGRDSTAIANTLLNPPPQLLERLMNSANDHATLRKFTGIIETAEDPDWLLST